jgi:hypothetical protein
MEDERDIITGDPLPDREDEPIRQAAERLLLDLGYAAADIGVEATRQVQGPEGCVCVRADLLVAVAGRPALLMRCVRGSLVSRERESVAAARLIADPWVPLAMAYNGSDAELLDVASGKVTATGVAALPGPAGLAEMVAGLAPHSPSPAEIAKAARVYSAFSFLQCPSHCTV